MILSVKKAMRILDHVAEKGRTNIKELSELMDMPKSTVCGLAQTLVACSYLYQEPSSGDYLLSYKFLRFGINIVEKFGIRDCALPVIKKLAEITRETVNLTVLDETQVLYVLKIESSKIQTGVREGGRAPLHCTASGKAMLAHLPQDRVNNIIGRCLPLEAFTNKSIVTVDEILCELEGCRKHGYALSKDELVYGVSAIAGFIHGYPGREAAALSVVGSTPVFTREKIAELEGYIIEACREISRRFKG